MTGGETRIWAGGGVQHVRLEPGFQSAGVLAIALKSCDPTATSRPCEFASRWISPEQACGRSAARLTSPPGEARSTAPARVQRLLVENRRRQRCRRPRGSDLPVRFFHETPYPWAGLLAVEGSQAVGLSEASDLVREIGQTFFDRAFARSTDQENRTVTLWTPPSSVRVMKPAASGWPSSSMAGADDSERCTVIS